MNLFYDRSRCRNRSDPLPIFRILFPLLLLPGLALATTAPADGGHPGNCLQTVFEERFDQPWQQLLKRWKTSYVWGNDPVINNELQYYLQPDRDGASPFSTRDGILTIVAQPVTPRLKKRIPAGRQYTSGLMTTERHFALKYGRFEIRAKLPPGRGLWPAFWMLPAFDRWPEGVDILPEIDIMEFLGHDRKTYHTTVHSNQSGSLRSDSSRHRPGPDLTKGFHDYAVEWDEREIRWYFDDRLLSRKPTPRDLHRPMYLLINLAVGGNWPGKPDKHTRFPARLQIDRVRIRKFATACGKGD